MSKIIIRRPDDFHVHLRDGEILNLTVPASSRAFRRVMVMPNLIPPVITVEQAEQYRQRIRAMIPEGKELEPLMTLYLTDNTSLDEIIKVAQSNFIKGVKFYPVGVTTNSAAGVTDLSKVYPVLSEMEKQGVVLLIHGESFDSDIDIFDREARFIDQQLSLLVKKFPELKIVFEHLTTKEAVDFVKDVSSYIGATITAHHLLINRNDLLFGGLKPHNYCMPILKRREDQKSLIEAVTSGNPKFFAGTDSAPHLMKNKESSCGCAGCFTAEYALELYAESFDRAGKIDKLENFVSRFGAEFYGLPLNKEKITLVRVAQVVPNYEGGKVVRFWEGEVLNWRLIEN